MILLRWAILLTVEFDAANLQLHYVNDITSTIVSRCVLGILTTSALHQKYVLNCF